MLWNYEKGITQSFSREFRKCKMQCRLNYVEGWTPKVDAIWFRYGHVFHHILQHSYLRHKPYSVEEIEKSATDYINFWEQDQIKQFGSLPVKQQEQNEYIIAMAVKMLPMYFLYKQDDFKDYEWLETEEIFQIPFQDTKILGCFDGVMRSKKTGKLQLMDHKCLSVFNASNLIELLPHDTQINLYILAAWVKYGELPDRLIYNIIRRSQVKRRKDESYLEYAERISHEVIQDPDHFFKRIEIPLSQEEVLDWKENQLTALVSEIRDWFEKGCSPYPFNEDSLDGKYGRSRYWDLIVHQNTLDYYQRTITFPELGIA